MANRERFAILAQDFREAERGETSWEAKMRYWFGNFPRRRNGEVLLKDVPECGTEMCIAGRTIWRFAEQNTVVYVGSDGDGDTNDIRREAEYLLGITEKESNKLCFVSSWPQKWYDMRRTNEAGAMAEICERIANGEEVLDVMS
jgi:hypothetical protein